ncbi:MAG TPA: phosphodiester glycosidase family protein [Candidatus Saccharimonadales bacterium]|nr:phosphodiester glycosidase family protein [Candidatus Saccharimonadales bacterium]
MRKGFVILPVLIVILIIAAFIFVEIKNGTIKLSFPSPTLTATASEIPTNSPTVTPTITPSPKPLVTSTPTASAKPTLAPVSGPPGAGLSTINVATQLGNFTATVLSLDLSGTRVITDTGNDSDCATGCSVLNLQTFVTRNGGFAGVNGTYFCPITYPECSSKTNSYDFSVYNTRLGHWINQGMLSWNGRAIVYFDGGGAHYLQNANSFSGGLTAGLTNYPGLVDGGNVQIDDNQSGLSDKQKAVGTKVGIGVRGSNNIMVVVAPSVNMQQFAHVFKSLGATGALNLDTGGSTALFYGGHYVFGPGRDIPNAIIFASK